MATIDTSRVVVPESLAQAADDQKSVGELLHAIQEKERACEKDIAQRRKQTADAIRPLEQEVYRLARGIHGFAQEHRKELTEGRRKTVLLPHGGSFVWYSTPAAVSIRDAKEVLAYLKLHRMKRFIRVKEEVDKEALLRERETAEEIPGVSVRGGKKFALRPPSTKTRVECNVATKRWKITRVS